MKQLTYTDEEFWGLFNLKTWKGLETWDLNRLTTSVEQLTKAYTEGIEHLKEHRNNYSSSDFENFVYASIQQNRADLMEKVYNPFVEQHGENEVEFDDFAACIELQKIIHRAHEEFRNKAKALLSVNPDDTSNWRNAIRKCQHCGEIWVKVQGCDGDTTCGARPSAPDVNAGAFVRVWWEMIDGVLRPQNAVDSSQQTTAKAAVREEKSIGCGKTINWKNQAVVPSAELDTFFTTQALQDIMGSFKTMPQFQKAKQKKEKGMPTTAFGQLGADGKDIK